MTYDDEIKTTSLKLVIETNLHPGLWHEAFCSYITGAGNNKKNIKSFENAISKYGREFSLYESDPLYEQKPACLSQFIRRMHDGKNKHCTSAIGPNTKGDYKNVVIYLSKPLPDNILEFYKRRISEFKTEYMPELDILKIYQQ